MLVTHTDEIPPLFAPDSINPIDKTPMKTQHSIASANKELQFTSLANKFATVDISSTPLKRPSGQGDTIEPDEKENKLTQDIITYEGPSAFPNDPLALSASLVHIEQERESGQKVSNAW